MTLRKHIDEAASLLAVPVHVAPSHSATGAAGSPPRQPAPGPLGPDPVKGVAKEAEVMNARSAQILDVKVQNVEARAAVDQQALADQRAKFEARNRDMEAQLAEDERRLADLAEAAKIASRIEAEEATFQAQVAQDNASREAEPHTPDPDPLVTPRNARPRRRRSPRPSTQRRRNV